MEAYHIDRFSAVDGIVLRAGSDVRPGQKKILMRVRARISRVWRPRQNCICWYFSSVGHGVTFLSIMTFGDGALLWSAAWP